MKMKKVVSLAMAALITASMFSGCGKKDDGRVHISIGNWPAEGTEWYEKRKEPLEDFRKNHPDIDIQPNTYSFDTKTFVAKATAKQLPTSFNSPLTETDMIIKNGYCRDISQNLEKIGMLDKYNPTMLDFVRGENGEIYGLPTSFYAQGLFINKKIFKEAGLVNGDGSVKVPKTYDEVLEFAGIIKEKTGKAGFVLPTVDNCGGWNFMNIAWSYGVEFMEEKDGKWTATFDLPEMKKALEWIRDLKWKYNALPDNSVISNGEREKLFATYQAGMMFSNPPASNMVASYGINKDDIACFSVPAGPKGKFSQTGGEVIYFNKDATDAEVDAALLWYVEKGGWNMEITEDSLKLTEDTYKVQSEAGYPILDHDEAFPKFQNLENKDKADALRAKYANVDLNDWIDYYNFENVTLKPEEPKCCQQLYAVLDGVIQKIITDKNADIDELIKTAVNDFQKNHLDNL